MTGESIAVVGPGRMGVGIATAVLMADRGHTVTLIDTKKRAPDAQAATLARARAEVEANLKLLDELGVLRGDAAALAGGLGRGAEANLKLLDELGVLRGDAAALAGGLGTTAELEKGLAGCTFLFEALPEKVAIKREFYQTVGPFIGKEAVVASATSTFHLDVFWEVCTRPANVVSAHWLNPAFLIPLVEVAYGEKTHPWVPDRLLAFLRDIGKIAVKMKTSPGFIVPRIQAAAMNEAIRILQEGVTTAAEIDTAIKAGFGFRLAVLGLIEFVDLGGVDILFHAGEYLHAKLGGEHFKPPELLREKMLREEVGPRTGKGFYDYAGLDTRALFNRKYKGFIELLRLYERCEYLDFSGGIAGDRPPDI